MSLLPMIPAHEREHIDQAWAYFARRVGEEAIRRWERAIAMKPWLDVTSGYAR
jgi:hypothetical protein